MDEIGAIVVKGPSIIDGYLSAADTADLFTQDGWLDNGDLGRIDGHGYLWVTGRAKDVIIRGGHIENISHEKNSMKHFKMAYGARYVRARHVPGPIMTERAACPANM